MISEWGGDKHVYRKCRFKHDEDDIVKAIHLGKSEAKLEK
jgi:hypothetical protein